MSAYDDWKCTEPDTEPAPEKELPDVSDVPGVFNTREDDFTETEYERRGRRLGL